MSNLLRKAAVAAMVLVAAIVGSSSAFGAPPGTNPIITDVYTADPAPLVVGNTVYLYTGHDEPNASFYTMNDWRCYSSQDMTNWTSHGTILSHTNFTWASGGAWAGQCVQKNGKFYWYVPMMGNGGYGGFNIGVAVSDSPTGPFVDARGTPFITDGMTTGGDAWDDIDPTVFTDTNGVSWIGWGHGTVYLAQLATNMTELAGPIQAIRNLPYFTEGPWLHRRGDLYYLSYASSMDGGGEKIRYATATNIAGPWTPRGLITGYPANSYTTHPGLCEFNGQSYLFYHNGNLPGGGSFDRSVCVDYLYYNPDGTIQPVFQTTAGVSVPPRNDNLPVGFATQVWPANGATNVPWSPALRWAAGSNAVAHAVYVGTGSNAVAQATFTSPEYQGTPATTNFSPSALAPQTLYFWRVDEIRGTNISHGAVGSFTTGPFLAHRYSFGEIGGSSVADAAGGAAWTGTLPNGGVLGGGQLALSAGSQQYVSLPAGIVNQLGGSTLMTWVNLSSSNRWSRIFDFGSGTTTYMYVTPASDGGALQFRIRTPSGGEQTMSSSTAVSLGGWHQVAVTLSGDTGIPGMNGAGGSAILYLDGVAVSATGDLTINPASLGNTVNNYLGKSQFGSDPYLNGAMDEFRIYNGVLSAADIAQTYFVGPTQVGLSPTNSAFPWLTQDVGAVGRTGGATFRDGGFTVTGSGADIWDATDAFRFVYVTNSGNCTIVARVNSLQNTDPWSKAGIMIRESLNANAANVFMAVTPGNGVAWQSRSSTGGVTGNAATASLTAPYWVKLVRSGNTFTGYRSPDGVTWTQQGTATFTMSSTAYIGLALTSHNNSSLCTATFDNVTVPGWSASQPPLAPTGLVAAAGNAQVALTWMASSNATSYNVKRATVSGGPYTPIAAVTTTNYTDTGLNNGSAYFYVVTASNAGGESGNSSEASVVPQGTASAELELAHYTASNPLKIMPVGDSITDDCVSNGAWRLPLQPLLEANGFPFTFVGRNASTGVAPFFTKVRHEGWCGAVVEPPGILYGTDNYLFKRVPDALGAATPDVLLLLIGANDIGNGRDPYALATNTMATLLGMIYSNAPNARVILAKPTSEPYYGDNIPIFGAYLQKLVNQRRALGQRVALADMYSVVDSATMFNADNLHPNGTGLAMIAKEWLTRLQTITIRPDLVSTLLVNGGASWKYNDKGISLGTNWSQVNFDDRNWSNGVARLGYGDPTVMTTVSFGPQSANKYLTTYFRRPFVVPANSVITNLNLRIARADGAVVYLNGREIYRTNLPAGQVGFTTPASTSMNYASRHIFYPADVPVNLAAGTNWLAVEVHLSSPTAAAMGFDLELIGTGYPFPWQSQDVGAVGIPGGMTFTNGVFTATGAGADISGVADAFRFTYVPMTGDGAMIARVASVQNTDPWAKAGIMIRESLAADAANALIALTSSNGVTWQNRSSTGGATSFNNTGGLSAPYWVKLVRSGNTFTGYRSPDGTNWTQQGTATISMASTAYIGMAVTSHNNSSLCAATFDSVTAPNWPPLAAPAGLTATAVSGSQVNLTWNAVPNATVYNVKRSATTGGPYTNIATGVTTNYADSSVTVSAGCYYVVSAMVGGNETLNSAEAAPSFPKLTGAIIGTAGSYNSSGDTIAKVFDNNLNTFFDAPDANGAWAGLDFGVGVSNVITKINYCPRAGSESRMVGGVFQGANQANFSGAVTLYTVATQPASGGFTSVSVSSPAAFRYVRYLSPDNGFGNVAEVEFYGYQFSASATVPSGLIAQVASTSQINLVWNGLTNATSYNVKRSLTNGGSYTTIASGVIATNYLDSGLAGGTMYFYVVSAVVSGSGTPNSAQASAATVSSTEGSLVHRYSFSDPTGTSIADSVGGPIWNGALPNGGTLAGGQLTLATASSQYANLPVGIVNALSNFTIVTWVRLNSTANWSRIFDFGGNTTTNMFLTPQNGADGRVRFAITTGGGEQQINCNSTMSAGVWYQVAVTLNGNIGKLYLNGLPVGTNNAMTLRPSSLGSTGNNYLGRSQYPDPHLDGTIDEFRIYNVGLSAAEVAQLHAGGSSQVYFAGTVTLGSLSQTYNGAAKSASATTTPSGLTVNLTYNGSANAPTNAGSYTVIGTITDANYQGSATNTLVINKATGTVTLGNLNQNYDGTAKSATATTTPTNLPVNLTYNGSVNAPTNVGNYAVIGTINDANYQGSATNTLVIGNAIRPQMSLALVGTNLTVSWPQTNTGFTVQFCTNLTLGGWLNVTSPAPQMVSNQWQVALPPATNAGSIFYRLSK